jgi:DNA-binding NarL/FixJ family response regulator
LIKKNNSMGIRVLIADDHTILREGLRSILEKKNGLECVGEAEDGRSAVKMAKELRPDIVIMDVAMPDLNGIEATRQIHAEMPEINVIALSMHAGKSFILAALNAGVSGYLLKDSAFEEMAGAISSVRKGEMYLSPAITEVVPLEEIRKFPGGQFVQRSVLTNREREVLQLIAEGKSTKQTAAKLGVSVKTVETHRKQIMDKLNIYSVAGLTKHAIREGITSVQK